MMLPMLLARAREVRGDPTSSQSCLPLFLTRAQATLATRVGSNQETLMIDNIVPFPHLWDDSARRTAAEWE